MEPIAPRLLPWFHANKRLLPERQKPSILFKPGQQRLGDGAHQKPPQVRGNGMTSRMLGMPVTYINRRSKPRP